MAIKKIIFNKFNQHVWVTVGGDIKVFVTSNSGMRVNPSQVFNSGLTVPWLFSTKIKKFQTWASPGKNIC